jgi:hypothetical protein
MLNGKLAERYGEHIHCFTLTSDLDVKTFLFLDSKMLTKLNFGSCEELRAHGVDIPGYFTIAGAATYCPGWSK